MINKKCKKAASLYWELTQTERRAYGYIITQTKSRKKHTHQDFSRAGEPCVSAWLIKEFCSEHKLPSEAPTLPVTASERRPLECPLLAEFKSAYLLIFVSE